MIKVFLKSKRWIVSRFNPNEKNLVVLVLGIVSPYEDENILGGCWIDKGVAETVVLLNNLGIKTYFSCSGIARDHSSKEWLSPYIMLDFNNEVMTIAKQCGFRDCLLLKDKIALHMNYVGKNYFETTAPERMPYTDKEIRANWKKFNSALKFLTKNPKSL